MNLTFPMLSTIISVIYITDMRAPGMGNNLVVKVHSDSVEGTASRKQGCLSWDGIRRKSDMEAEKCLRGQSFGPTNRNLIQG